MALEAGRTASLVLTGVFGLERLFFAGEPRLLLHGVATRDGVLGSLSVDGFFEAEF